MKTDQAKFLEFLRERELQEAEHGLEFPKRWTLIAEGFVIGCAGVFLSVAIWLTFDAILEFLRQLFPTL